MKKFLLLTVVCLGITSVGVWAQERTVTGKVTSAEDGSPLPGVNVVVKGSAVGTVTDVNGAYSVSVPPGATLVFSFIGLTSVDEPVGERTIVDVRMSQDVQQLGEVVVTAAGIERQTRALGYSVAKVDGDKVALKSEPDALRSLQGKVAGVNILSTSGAPGSATRITIRGNKSFFGNNQPLFIVDGIPFDNDYDNTSNELTEGAAYSSRIADLDPNNIESINILPGGAAAALYGVRAANGVVVVTTKAGSSRAPRKGLEIAYSSGFSIEQIANRPEYQNKYGTGSRQQYGEANGSWGAPFDRPGPGVTYNDDGTFRPNGTDTDYIPYWASYAAVFPEHPDTVPYRPYPNNVNDFFRTGKVFDNAVTIRGGNEKSVFTAVASRMHQDGFMPFSKYGRTTINVGGSTELSNGFNAGGSVSFINAVQKGPLSGNGDATQVSASALSRILYPGRNWDITGQPYEDPTTRGNLFFLGDAADNPYWSARYNGLRSEVNRVAANLKLGYDFNDWLTAEYRVGVNTYTDRRKEVTRKGSVGAAGVGKLILDDTYFQELESNLLFTADRTFREDFSFKAILGFNVNQRTGETQRVLALNSIAFDIDDIDNFNNVTPFGGEYYRRRLLGVLGDLSFGYKDFLFLNFTGRNDWSSTLPKSRQSFFYPSVSTSFVFTDAFELSPRIFTSGKIRVAWSRVGNDADVYSLYPTYRLNFSSNSGLLGSLPGNDLPFRGQPGATTDITVYDPDLTPEFTTTFELGTDLVLFDDRLDLKVTLYDIRTTDQIAPISLADETGYNRLITNFGETSNRGIEIGLDATPVRLANGFSWNIFTTFTCNRNYVESLVPGVDEIVLEPMYGGQVTPMLAAGRPYGALYGTYNLRDDEGALLIDPATGLAIQSKDLKYLGNPNPDFLASLGTGFRFKGVTLSCLWNYRHGGDLYSTTTQFYLGRGVTRDTEDREGYFIVPGVYGDPDTGLPLLDESGNKIPNTTSVLLNDIYFQTTSGSFGINGADEVSIFDATVIRLSEVSLGYTFPQSLLSRTPFGSASITLTGRNLWYNAPNFPKYTNFDPETSSFGAQNYTGLEYVSAPSVKRFGVNLLLTF